MSLDTRDYIRAVQLANAAVSEGETGVGYYCILGIAYAKLGQYAEAEMYSRQTFEMSPKEDSFRATARYAILIVLYSRYELTPARAAATQIGLLALAATTSDARTLLPEDEEEAFREWAQKIADRLWDISGTWTDGDGRFIPIYRENTFLIERRSDSVYRFSLQSKRDGAFKNIAFGDLSRSGSTYAGTISLSLMPSNLQGWWEQKIYLSLRIADTFDRLEGTAKYYEGTAEGKFADFRRALPAGTIELALTRRD